MTNDPRIVHNRKAIKRAFFQLMQTKNFAKISISEVANLAHVSRHTFYHNYQDKQDFLTQTISEMANDVQQIIKIAASEPDIDDKDFALQLIDYFKQNKLQILAMNTIFPNYIRQIFVDNGYIITDKLLSVNPRLDRDRVNKYAEYLTLYASNALNSLLINWLKDDAPMNEADLCRLIYDFITTPFKHIKL